MEAFSWTPLDTAAAIVMGIFMVAALVAIEIHVRRRLPPKRERRVTKSYNGHHRGKEHEPY